MRAHEPQPKSQTAKRGARDHKRDYTSNSRLLKPTTYPSSIDNSPDSNPSKKKRRVSPAVGALNASAMEQPVLALADVGGAPCVDGARSIRVETTTTVSTIHDYVSTTTTTAVSIANISHVANFVPPTHVQGTSDLFTTTPPQQEISEPPRPAPLSGDDRRRSILDSPAVRRRRRHVKPSCKHLTPREFSEVEELARSMTLDKQFPERLAGPGRPNTLSNITFGRWVDEFADIIGPKYFAADKKGVKPGSNFWYYPWFRDNIRQMCYEVLKHTAQYQRTLQAKRRRKKGGEESDHDKNVGNEGEPQLPTPPSRLAGSIAGMDHLNRLTDEEWKTSPPPQDRQRSTSPAPYFHSEANFTPFSQKRKRISKFDVHDEEEEEEEEGVEGEDEFSDDEDRNEPPGKRRRHSSEQWLKRARIKREASGSPDREMADLLTEVPEYLPTKEEEEEEEDAGFNPGEKPLVKGDTKEDMGLYFIPPFMAPMAYEPKLTWDPPTPIKPHDCKFCERHRPSMLDSIRNFFSLDTIESCVEQVFWRQHEQVASDVVCATAHTEILGEANLREFAAVRKRVRGGEHVLRGAEKRWVSKGGIESIVGNGRYYDPQNDISTRCSSQTTEG